ncbi:MCE family protein [Mycolicibacterium sp. P9-22]|uniref:MCE family protein n=1 Tax=Mycolicibacterium sp. P9-22 TaxID=2024613 RepID=UPI0011EE1985|nr:MlaD family protein [Mycolicibacterium sp. P9-22]KAA0114614.1 MCE family protein [Mycolicibacterium sp. P9-22]
MLTRFVRAQLIIFTVASVIGVGIMVVVYLQAATLLGIGRMSVTLELPGTGGLYRFSNVTYRGVQIGKVTEIHATRDGAQATLSLETAAEIPADLHAAVLSVSAVGEQYVDLQPAGTSGPFLRDGDVIPAASTSIPQAVGPMLDQMSVLLDSVPTDRIPGLLDETYRSLNGARYDLGSLLDSSSELIGKVGAVSEQTRALIDDSSPLLDGQAESAAAIRSWAKSMSGIAAEVDANDAEVRTLLSVGPDAADEASALLSQTKATLPVLLANLTTVGQVAVTYNAALEQLLVVLPPDVAVTQAYGLARNNPTGQALADFTLTLNDPPACSVGFLPPSQWRSPADTSDIDTPDGLYCKLPQDSPIGVRGARNYPCMGVPGKRAPTVEICNSDRPYEPLAMRQHALGPMPIDPSLIAQGIPPDDRVDFSDQIFGPVEGAPPPATQPPPASPPPAVAPTVAPSGFVPGGTAGPSVALATYDPQTGRYAGPDGTVYRQTDLAPQSGNRTWEDMFPT